MTFAELALLALVACGASEDPVTPPARPADGPDYLSDVRSEAEWRSIAASPPSFTVAHTEVVKFLIDHADGGRVYLLNARRWPIHFDFARTFLDRPGHPVRDHALFNRVEYREERRRFVLGTLVHYLDADRWTFGFIAGDTLSGPRIRDTYERLRAHVYFGAELRFQPLSALHERNVRDVDVPILRVDELMASVRFQPLTLGTSFGVLHLIDGELDPASVAPGDIVVTRTVPDDLPVTAALVTSALQAPLSHVAILSENRRTPNMALVGAIDDPSFRALDGQPVRLRVTAQDFELTRSTPEELERFSASRRPPAESVPAFVDRGPALVELCDAGDADVGWVGAKAAQLGEVCRERIGHTPGGFTIPIAVYRAHVERSGLVPAIDAMLADPAFRSDRRVRAERLGALARSIEQVAIDPALVRGVAAALGRLGSGRLIFRSSTNAEDLVGFSGAGLYRSVVVDRHPSDAAIADAIRRVWASVWTLRGFDEREWYRIRHRDVGMGVLVQPFVPDIHAVGVAITANPFFAGRPGIFVNAQIRGGSVTDAGDDVAEQLLVYTYTETLETEILSRSSLTGGAPVLEQSDIGTLARQLGELHRHFVPRYRGGANAVDVEFAIAGTPRAVVLLQARPYTVVYRDE
jgi:rifampicin phosphotransferase